MLSSLRNGLLIAVAAVLALGPSVAADPIPSGDRTGIAAFFQAQRDTDADGLCSRNTCTAEGQDDPSPSHPGGGGGGGGAPRPPSCDQLWVLMSPQPEADWPGWKGRSPDGFDVYRTSCPPVQVGPNKIWETRVFPEGAPPAPPGDPGATARDVLARIKFPKPVINFGPDPEQVAVNIPVWLSVEDPGARADSATERGLTVTVAAVVRSVTFSMGESGSKQVKCKGIGAAPAPGADLADPPCGFTYQLRSLPARTGGSGKWTVTATVNWNVHWVASNGEAGDLDQSMTSTTALYVGEYRTVILPPR